jgi:hypothetical protein
MTVHTGAARIVMPPDGGPVTVEANQIRASGELDRATDGKATNTAPPDIEKVEGAAVEGAETLRNASIHTHTPLIPGRYGERLWVGVPTGAVLNVNVEVRDGALTAGTNVHIAPPLETPTWMHAGGIDLETKGNEGILRADIKGFFDLDITKYAVGKSKMSLDVVALTREVMDNMHTALEQSNSAQPKSAQDVAADAAWLQEKHAEWEEKVGKKKPTDDQAASEPRAASPAELATKGADVMKTTGTADVDLARQGSEHIDARLHGSVQGGKVHLTADQVMAGAGGAEIAAKGVDSGDIQIDSKTRDPGAPGDGAVNEQHVAFDSFSIEQLRMQAPTKSK